MNKSKSILNGSLALLFFATTLSFPSFATAGHDHDHIYVKMVEYLGHDENGMHMVKVNHHYNGRSHYYMVYLGRNARSLRGHQGDSFQISLTGDGKRWARLTLRGHGTWQIDGVRAL